MVRAVNWLRGPINSLIFPLWTMLSVSGALFWGWLKRDPDNFYRAQRGWARWLFRLCGIDLDVNGSEHMATDAAYVVVCNHSSYMDIPALFASLPTLPQFMAKRELSRIPFLGAALRAGRHLLVDRGNHHSAKTSLERASEQLRPGAAILIFPEGTRGNGVELGSFKTGAFRLAKLAHAAILPVGIVGTHDVLPKHGRVIAPHRVSVSIGPAISVEETQSLSLGELSQRVRSSIAQLSRLAPATSTEPRDASLLAH
jgi:1-acyl-sn-glycerol-3-phosphate acyltransferase